MRNFVLALLVGTIALAPTFAAAQTGSGSGTKPSGTPGTSSGSGSGTMPSTGSTGSSGSGSSTPSASPSGADLSTFKTQADCEKNGGMWTAATKACAKK